MQEGGHWQDVEHDIGENMWNAFTVKNSRDIDIEEISSSSLSDIISVVDTDIGCNPNLDTKHFGTANHTRRQGRDPAL